MFTLNFTMAGNWKSALSFFVRWKESKTFRVEASVTCLPWYWNDECIQFYRVQCKILPFIVNFEMPNNVAATFSSRVINSVSCVCACVRISLQNNANMIISNIFLGKCYFLINVWARQHWTPSKRNSRNYTLHTLSY